MFKMLICLFFSLPNLGGKITKAKYVRFSKSVYMLFKQYVKYFTYLPRSKVCITDFKNIFYNGRT